MFASIKQYDTIDDTETTWRKPNWWTGKEAEDNPYTKQSKTRRKIGKKKEAAKLKDVVYAVHI